MKKILAMLLALIMVFSLVACGGNNEQPEDMGTIIWLSNLTSGAQYDATNAYLTALCNALGYDFQVVFGDMMNDAATNLQYVQQAMTDDVVGMIASQDGGLKDIMDAYPNLWVAGYNCDMRSVYAADGLNAAVLNNDHYLGTIADGYSNGMDLGAVLARQTIDLGYKKVAIVNFPPFAYPNLTEAVIGYTAAIEEYNKTASEPIEIVGEVTTLMFSPLEDSWFLEEGRSDLDAIIGMCAGVQFIYPTLSTAIANGTCSADTKLITSGFETDPDIIADIGGDGVITSLTVSAAENPAYALILIDNAITGNVAAGTSNECVDSAEYTIDSVEDINNVMTKTMMGTGDVANAHLTVDEVVAMCGRNNPKMTWEEIVAVFHDISVDELK